MSSPKSPKNKSKRKKTDDSKELMGNSFTKEFPTTLEGFKYKFTTDGHLVHIETGDKFNFQVSGDHSYNQRHYEALGEVITEHVYQLLTDKVKLKKQPIPGKQKSNASKKQAKGFIFVSENFEIAEKLLVLVHGSGVVKAGQWARRLIINDCLHHGTQIPYIEKGFENDYGIVVMNTNQNEALVQGKKKHIKDSATPMEHFNHVWKNYVEKAKAEKIFVVAHSYGGHLIVDYLVKNQKAIDRVKAVAFTDSVHSLSYQTGRQTDIQKWFKKNSINWVTSNKDLDTPMQWEEYCYRRSAGTTIHEETSWKAMDSIFEYFKKILDGTGPGPCDRKSVSPGEAKSNHPVDGQMKSGSQNKTTLLELSSNNDKGNNVPCSSEKAVNISDGTTSQGGTNDSGGVCSASETNVKIVDDEKISEGGTNCDSISGNSEGDTNDGGGANTSGSASGTVRSKNVGDDKSSHGGTNSDNIDGSYIDTNDGRSGNAGESVGDEQSSHGGTTGDNVSDGGEGKSNDGRGAITGSASGTGDESVGDEQSSNDGTTGDNVSDGGEGKTNDGANTGSASGTGDESVGVEESSNDGTTGDNVSDGGEGKTNDGRGANTGSASGTGGKNVVDNQRTHGRLNNGNIGDGSEGNTDGGGNADTGSASGIGDENGGTTGDNIGGGSQGATNDGDVEDASVYSPSETGGNNSDKYTSGTNGEQVGGSSQATTGGKSNGNPDAQTDEENNGKISCEDRETSDKLNEKDPCGGNEGDDDKSNSIPGEDGKDNGCARSLAGTDEGKAGARTSIPAKPNDDKTTTHQEKVESEIPNESENVHVKTEETVASDSENQDKEKSKL